MSEIEQLQYKNSLKVNIIDMHANFKELGDLLLVKFS